MVLGFIFLYEILFQAILETRVASKVMPGTGVVVAQPSAMAEAVLGKAVPNRAHIYKLLCWEGSQII